MRADDGDARCIPRTANSLYARSFNHHKMSTQLYEPPSRFVSRARRGSHRKDAIKHRERQSRAAAHVEFAWQLQRRRRDLSGSEEKEEIDLFFSV